MDDRLQKALDFSKYRQTLAIQRKLLKEKLEAKLTYGYAGGIFSASVDGIEVAEAVALSLVSGIDQRSN